MSSVTDIVKGFMGGFKTPQTPVVQQVAPPKEPEEEKKKIKKRKKTTQTVLTTPLGLTGAAATKKPSLLGE